MGKLETRRAAAHFMRDLNDDLRTLKNMRQEVGELLDSNNEGSRGACLLEAVEELLESVERHYVEERDSWKKIHQTGVIECGTQMQSKPSST
jgi:hypothetical protein